MACLLTGNFWPAQQRQNSSFFLSSTVFFSLFHLCSLWRVSWAALPTPWAAYIKCREKSHPISQVKELSPLCLTLPLQELHRELGSFSWGSNTLPINPFLSNKALLICVNYHSFWQRKTSPFPKVFAFTFGEGKWREKWQAFINLSRQLQRGVSRQPSDLSLKLQPLENDNTCSKQID